MGGPVAPPELHFLMTVPKAGIEVLLDHSALIQEVNRKANLY